MFTGIIETLGTLKERRSYGNGARLKIIPAAPFENLCIGESIAVDGICLTVTDITGDAFYADASQTTLETTRLATKPTGSKVNLERAMAANGRFGGHIVSGHVDESAMILSVDRQKDSTRLTLQVSEKNSLYLIPKGSIAIDGISLTVAELDGRRVTLVLIPHSLQATTLETLQAGDMVHVEFDQIAKYLYRFLHPEDPDQPAKDDTELLKALTENGFI